MKTHELVHELVTTSAIFGRDKEVTLAFEGDGAYTDGKQIVLPSLDQNVELTHEAAMVLRGYVDHEAGHVRHTDFEAHRKFSSTSTERQHKIWNCLEDMWLERKVMAEYPGAEKNLRQLSQTVGVKELADMVEHKDVYDGMTEQGVAAAILRAGRLSYGGDVNAEMYDMLTPEWKAWGNKWIEEVHKCENSSQVMNMAIEIDKMLTKEESKSDSDKEQDKKDKAAGKPVEGLAGDPENFEYDPNADITQGKPVPDKVKGKPMPGPASGKMKVTGDSNEWIKDYLKQQVDLFYDAPEAKSYQKYRVLSTRFDEVYTRDKTPVRSNRRWQNMKANNAADYERHKVQLGGLVNTMKAKLRRALMAKEQRDWDFGREFGRLDTKRLVAGVLGSPSVYKMRQDRLEQDTAVHLLVDLSGSMSGDRVRTAADTVMAFAECLEGTQIKYQISGFENSGITTELNELVRKAHSSSSTYHRYEPLNLYKFKGFNESLQVSKGSVYAIRDCAGGNNSDRDAVLWAKEELKAMPHKRKILMVLSDGQPANDMIGGPGRGSLEAALKNAIDECVKDGVECVGIGIETEHVNRLYPKSVAITNVNDLSGAVFTQLSNLLTGGKVNL